MDLAVATSSDTDAEKLASEVAAAGYQIAALVEHEDLGRLSTVRLRSRARVHLDLLVASSGIEREIVEAATSVDVPGVGPLAVARAEDLLATKILSMSSRRPQDRIDARNLILASPSLDLAWTRRRLSEIRARGFHREQDLESKLEDLLSEVRAERD